MEEYCTKCKTKIEPSQNFCSNCGAENRHLPEVPSLKDKIRIYILSFVLAPIGLYWFIKYVKSGEKSWRLLGWQALGVTLIAVLLSFLTIRPYLSALENYSSVYGSQMQIYNNLEY